MDIAALSVRFEQELTALGGSCQIADSLDEVHRVLRAELLRWKASRTISWSRDQFPGWKLDWLWDELGCISYTPPGDAAQSRGGRLSDGPVLSFRVDALSADVGITGVDFALATTGTLALSAAPARPRSVSLLPAVHIALVRASQLVTRMGDALHKYFRGGALPPSAVHFISGPSRTSDIENDHTIGVHGPAAVSVILWRDTPTAQNGESTRMKPA